jgi:probable DNA metabolism protein
MPNYKIVDNPADVLYIYDGSFVGFLCCVFESFYSKELPVNIVSDMVYEPSLYRQKVIYSDETKAKNVYEAIGSKVSGRALEIVKHGFLCHHENKEHKLLKFLIMAFRAGAKVSFMLGSAEVAEVLAMERHMLTERHKLLGFIRFADYGDMLGAVISPKNFVLPLLAEHFARRFPNENFMIYDKTHKAALIYQNKKLEITTIEEIEFADDSEEELFYQDLWKAFYKAIGIKERLNPRCRMNLMPKRYWENMVEMREFL